MPKRCANRLRETGLKGEVLMVRALMEKSATTPEHIWAAGKEIQIFLEGCTEQLRPACASEYASYPTLVATGDNDALWLLPALEIMLILRVSYSVTCKCFCVEAGCNFSGGLLTQVAFSWMSAMRRWSVARKRVSTNTVMCQP